MLSTRFCRAALAVLALVIAFRGSLIWGQDPAPDGPCQPRIIQDDEDCTGYITGQFYYRIKKCKVVLRWTWVEKTELRECVVYDPVTCENEIVHQEVSVTEFQLRKTPVWYTDVKCIPWRIPRSAVNDDLECPCPDADFLKPDPEPVDDGEHNRPADPNGQVRAKPSEDVDETVPVVLEKATAESDADADSAGNAASKSVKCGCGSKEEKTNRAPATMTPADSPLHPVVTSREITDVRYVPLAGWPK